MILPAPESPSPSDDWRHLPGRKVRGQVQAFLNRALARPGADFPRIPLRRADEGGWRSVTESESGRLWADEWWRTAFADPLLADPLLADSAPDA